MERKRIQWNREKANRIYAYESTVLIHESNYWGFHFWKPVVHLASFLYGDLRGCNVLDYGCGMGHVVGGLLKKGAIVSAIDMSEESVAYCNKKYGSFDNYMGAKTYNGTKIPYEDGCFDMIICTECIEHMFDDDIEFVLREMHRALKNKGKIFFTTPNDENMEKSEVCCPECNTIFHRNGHVRTFTKGSLKELMEKYNYRTVSCEATNFDYIKLYLSKKPLLDVTLRRCGRRIEWILLYLGSRRNKSINSPLFVKYTKLKNKPHLFYCGEK